MFTGMLLDVDAGQNFEVVTVTDVTPGFIKADFNKSSPHLYHRYRYRFRAHSERESCRRWPGLTCVTAGYTGFVRAVSGGFGLQHFEALRGHQR